MINRKDSNEIPNSTKDSESRALQLPTGLASTTESVDDDSSSLQQNTNAMCQSNGYNAIGHGSQAQELEKKQANPKPLKVVVRHYSTKVQMRHHVEEAETDLECSDSDVEGSAATE